MSPSDDPYVVSLHGECDVSRYPQIRNALFNAGTSERLLVDLSAVTLLDSTILSEFIVAAHRWTSEGRRFVFLVPGESVYRLLSIAGLTARLNVVRNRALALERLG